MAEEICRQLLRTTCSVAAPTDSVADGVRLLLQGCHRRVYVTDDQHQLLGIVPDYELLKCILGGRPCEPLESLLSRHIEIAVASTAIRDIAPLFREARHSELPIVDDEHHSFLGVVFRNDVLRAVSGDEIVSTKTDDVLERPTAPQTVEADPAGEEKWLNLHFSRVRIDPADHADATEERPHFTESGHQRINAAGTSRIFGD